MRNKNTENMRITKILWEFRREVRNGFMKVSNEWQLQHVNRNRPGKGKVRAQVQKAAKCRNVFRLQQKAVWLDLRTWRTWKIKPARESTVKITEISEYWSRALMYFVSNSTGHSEEKHTNTKKAKGTFYMSKRSSNRSLDSTTRNV